jgi:hypothetical protein
MRRARRLRWSWPLTFKTHWSRARGTWFGASREYRWVKPRHMSRVQRLYCTQIRGDLGSHSWGETAG